MKIDWQLFRFPFDDANWLSKSLIGGLLALVGSFFSIPFFFLLWPLQGYGVRIMRATINGEAPSLPEWNDWGKLFGDGLKVWIVGFVYGLPVWILFACGYLAILVPAFAPLVGLATDDPEAFVALYLSSWFIGYAVFFITLGIAMLLLIPTVYLSVAAITRMVAHDSLGAAFEFGKVWELTRKGFSNYTLAVIALVGVITVISVIGSAAMYTIILACLYPVALIFITFYTQVVSGAVFGQAYYHTMISESEPSAAGAKPRRAAAKK